MSSVKELTEATFDEAIKNGVALVDFWASWCGPCRMMLPIIDQVEEAVGKKALVAKVNVDESKNLAAKFNVQMVPTLIFFKDGQVAKQLSGVQSKDKLVQAIDELLG